MPETGWYIGDFDEGCLSGHYWHGTSQCSRCGARLRCECGQYMREDSIGAHIDRCSVIAKLAIEEDPDA